MPTVERKEELNFTDTDTEELNYKEEYERLKKSYDALAKRFDKLAELYGIIVEKYLAG